MNIEPARIVKRILERKPSGVKGFMVDIVTYEEEPGIVYLRLYRDNFELLSEGNRQLIANDWIPEVISWASAAGVAVYLEVEDQVPNFERKIVL